MEVSLKSTSKVVSLRVEDIDVPARVWEGTTARGVRCHAFITRIAMQDGDDASEFEADLKEHSAPSAEVQAIPLRFIL
jgi:hypothetical protein